MTKLIFFLVLTIQSPSDTAPIEHILDDFKTMQECQDKLAIVDLTNVVAVSCEQTVIQTIRPE